MSDTHFSLALDTEVLVQEIGRQRQIVFGVSRRLELAGGLGPEGLLAHQAGHAVLPDSLSLGPEFPGNPWRAGSAPVFVIGALDHFEETLIGLGAGRSRQS